MTEIALPRTELAAGRRPRLGYAMTLVAATLFAVNGTVSKVILDTGISTLRLTELRATCGSAGLALGLALLAPERLRLSRREVPLLVFYGVVGFALVQWLYFVAIDRLPIGIGLLLEFTAPVLVALWARFAWHEPVRRRVWAALALVARRPRARGRGVERLLARRRRRRGRSRRRSCARGLLPHRRARRRPPRPDLARLLRASASPRSSGRLTQPWWSFPFGELARARRRCTATSPARRCRSGSSAWLIVLGTIVPFALSIGALRHLPATTVGIVATFEPVAAAVVAWVWLGEALDAAQLVGGLTVLAGIVLAETSR